MAIVASGARHVCRLPEALVNVSGNYSETVVVIKFGYMREHLIRAMNTHFCYVTRVVTIS